MSEILNFWLSCEQTINHCFICCICCMYVRGLLFGLCPQDSCRLTYHGKGGPGFYAVALQVEDFTSESSRVAMSSVPVQFLVKVVNVPTPPDGVKPPTFVGSTPSNGDCISIAIGSTYQTQITAKSGGGNAT